MLRSIDSWDSEHFAFNGAESPLAAAASTIAVDNGPDGPTATIPDAHLLFTAQFSRAGADLVLQGEDGKIVAVHDYFASDVRARLLSPEGAALSPDVVAALAGPLAPGQFAQAGAPQTNVQAVGRVAQVEGGATIIRNGVAMQANTGDAILKGDVLQTVTGSLGVTFNDGSTLNITANSRLVVNEFVYDPKGSQNSQLLDLVQGSLTFISGEVAHSGDMKIGTPVATMGIRGTVGGVTTANDGTVRFYVSQSATGAVILDSRGTIIANVVQDGPLIVVRPVGPLQVLAEELQKSPAQLATELAALQHIVSIKSVGDQLIQQFFQQNPTNNPNPQSTDHPHTQIPDTQIDLKPDPLADNGNNNDGYTPPVTAIVTIPPSPPTPGNPPPDPDPIIVTIPANLPPINFGPLTAAMNEDQTLTFTGQTAVSVFDADTGILTVTLGATHGVLTLGGNAAGLTFAAGDGTADAAMVFSGTQAAINAALNGMKFTPDADYNGNAEVTIAATDGNNTTATNSIAITVNAVNDAPVVTPGTAIVSEEGLCGGIADGTGNPDTTNSVIASGVIAAADSEGDQLTFTLGTPGTALTSNGVAITWVGAGTGTLTGVAGQTTVITVEIDPNTGAYTVTLSGPIDHPEGGAEDIKSFDVPVNVTDGTATTESSLTVTVEDDRPNAIDRSMTVTAGATQDFNAAFVLDYSTSIDNGELNTMLNAVKTAAQAIFNGTTHDVQITVVAFAASAITLGTYGSYLSFASAIDGTNPTLAGARPNLIGGTDFDAAIQQVLDHYSPVDGSKNEIFFLSDGQSSLSSTATAWHDFVTDYGISVTAVGIGNGVSDAGLRTIDVDGSGAPIPVAEFSDLVDSLLSLVGHGAAHNIFSDGETTDAGFGADGGHVASIDIDGVTYSWNGETLTKSDGETTPPPSGSSISVETQLGGHFEFYFASDNNHTAGDWSYKPPASLAAPTDEIFHYVLTDNDGDHADANITVAVTADNYTTPPVTADLTFNGYEDVYQQIDFDVSEGSAPARGFILDSLPDANVGHLQISSLNPNDPEGLAQIGVEYSADSSVYFNEYDNWNGTSTFQYHAVGLDGAADTTPATITLNWTPANDAPAAQPDHLIISGEHVDEDGGFYSLNFSLDFLAVNDDPDGGDSFFPTLPSDQGVELGPEGVIYTLTLAQNNELKSQPDAVVNDSFIYEITDEQSNVTSATASLSIVNGTTLSGDAANDILIGSQANETMTGGDGVDGFVFYNASGHDTITDFTPGVDKIVLSSFQLPSGTMSLEEENFLLHPTDEQIFNTWKDDWTVGDNSLTVALHQTGVTDTDTVTIAKAGMTGQELLDSLTVNDFIVHNIVGVA